MTPASLEVLGAASSTVIVEVFDAKGALVHSSTVAHPVWGPDGHLEMYSEDKALGDLTKLGERIKAGYTLR